MSTLISLRGDPNSDHVRQEEPNGCGVACLAMLTGKTYADVRADFPDIKSQGLSEVEVLHWLNARGWWYRRWWVSEPVAPTSPVSMVLVEAAHWLVVLTKNARYAYVLDPAVTVAKPLHDYRVLKWIELLPPEPEGAPNAK